MSEPSTMATGVAAYGTSAPHPIDWDNPPDGLRVRSVPISEEESLAFFEAVQAVQRAGVPGEEEDTNAAANLLEVNEVMLGKIKDLGGIENSPFRVRHTDLTLDFLVEGGDPNE